MNNCGRQYFLGRVFNNGAIIRGPFLKGPSFSQGTIWSNAEDVIPY